MIAICQSKEELNLVKEKYNKLPIILALNLETITFCKINKIDFILPFNNTNYHTISKKILINSNSLLNTLNFKTLKYDFLINLSFSSTYFVSDIEFFECDFLTHSITKVFLLLNLLVDINMPIQVPD